MGTDAYCLRQYLRPIAQPKKSKEPPFKDPETTAAVGQNQPVSVAAQIAREQPFRIDSIHRASAWTPFGCYSWLQLN
jgi:hypothetical protein